MKIEQAKDQLRCAINSAIMSSDKNTQRHYFEVAMTIFDNSLTILQQDNYYRSDAFQSTLERLGYYFVFSGKFDGVSVEKIRLIKEFLENEFNKI